MKKQGFLPGLTVGKVQYTLLILLSLLLNVHILNVQSQKNTMQGIVKEVSGATVGANVEEENYIPEGYTLVWQDEFNEARLAGGKPAMPHTAKWYYQTGDDGGGNNELQNYVAGTYGTDTCALITGGTLKIIAKKNANQVISIRMNTSESWQYGYFEAKLKLPQGKGTWPAFWMLPKIDQLTWPDDGEIDIMEEVGFRPNWISSSIHCKTYYHSIGTQKTKEKFIATAESDFHIYAVEWTEDYIWGYVDGECYFKFSNDKTGNKATWPFNVPFYLKLNLAWGGNWGGAQGVDESKLPATYEIDYVRVYQKK
jgi:beta-glucanase (GH16 family)